MTLNPESNKNLMTWIRSLSTNLKFYLISFVVLAAVIFSFLKNSWIDSYGHKKIEFAQATSEKVFSTFQTSFYFYYDEQFKPVIEDILRRNPELVRISVIGANEQTVFDSVDLAGAKTVPHQTQFDLPKSLAAPTIFKDREGLGVVVPEGQYQLVYIFSLKMIYLKLGLLLLIAFGSIFAAVFLSYFLKVNLKEKFKLPLSKIDVYSIRSKFIAAIVLVNIITGAIIFFSQSYIQKNEQLHRLIKNSVSVSELGKDHVINSFSNFFYFYYHDKFVPIIKQELSSKENLVAIRIVSRKTGMIVFDSDSIQSGKSADESVATKKAELRDDVLMSLRTKDTFYETTKLNGKDKFLRVITTYRNENQETPFFVEYVFSFASLQEKIDAVRGQIVVELVPSMLLGILIAILLSQLLVGPIKKLVAATRSITSGNYDVSVPITTKDELGELSQSFNAMADELKRKTELRKYLSEKSYKRIVESNSNVTTVGGARVRATVLFSDIRNFVNVCETLDADEVTSLLNEYFSLMVEVIYKHKGEVDKFIGDAILAVFYEDEHLKNQSNTALHAIYCAMEMREKLQEFNSRRVSKNKSPIDIGIGINSGEIISGPIGSRDRMDFTVIGDVVNLANRIEKLSKQGRHTRIVFSNHVETRIRGLLEYEELSREKIRGKEEDITVYELVKIKDVKELVQNLIHPDPSIKKHCIELLGYSRNLSALDQLYQKLSDSDDSVRISAIMAITRLATRDNAQVLDRLFTQLDAETSEKVISTLIICLGKICKTNRILKIEKFLHYSDERIVANTIEALGANDDPKVIDLLIPFVASKNNRVKANASMMLFAKGRIEVLDILKPMLLNSDYLMRASAAFALGELTVMATGEQLSTKLKSDAALTRYFLGELQSCVALLVSLLKDSQPIVKRQAIIALGKIKDKSAVLPLLDNLDTAKDSKELIHDVADALRSIGSHRLVRDVVEHLS